MQIVNFNYLVNCHINYFFVDQPNSGLTPSQQTPPAAGANTAAGTNANNTDAWQQYYQQYW